MEKNKQTRQIGFSRRLHERLQNERPELAKKLDEKELLFIIESVFEEISVLLRSGVRVIFEGYLSFYTKAIKRKCSDLHTGEDWMTHKRRLRWKPSPRFKEMTEIEISEEEYLTETKKT